MKTHNFTVSHTSGKARRGVIKMRRGDIQTPAFMPVGTAATVKTLTTDMVQSTRADVVLGNVYHLMLRPGAERLDRLGGLHEFMQWEKPILTDSGGFQVMSLASLRKLTEKGVTFRSHIDGSKHELTPERSIEIQMLLDSDIQMQLDECIAYPCTEEDAERAMELSLRWAQRSKDAFGDQPHRRLHGIVQGSVFPKLREKSVEALTKMDFDGYSIGGLAVGEGQEVMLDVLGMTCPILPIDKPRYLMGVGTPDDLISSIQQGVDMFDCVMPTRAGRHGLIYTRFGKINLKNAYLAEQKDPVDAELGPCEAATRYSRGYLHHLFKANEILGMVLASWINIAYYQQLMADARQAIENDCYDEFVLERKEQWAKGDPLKPQK